MEISSAQLSQLERYLPRPRGNVMHPNLNIINAILWLAENDCKWSALPSRFGSWHTVYTRVYRWSKSGVLDRVFEQMQRLQLIQVKLEVMSGPGGASQASSAHSWAQARRTPARSLSVELPMFAWVPRIRVRHRRLVLARRRVIDKAMRIDAQPSMRKTNPATAESHTKP